jgi:hypothetical protein
MLVRFVVSVLSVVLLAPVMPVGARVPEPPPASKTSVRIQYPLAPATLATTVQEPVKRERDIPVVTSSIIALRIPDPKIPGEFG